MKCGDVVKLKKGAEIHSTKTGTTTIAKLARIIQVRQVLVPGQIFRDRCGNDILVKEESIQWPGHHGYWNTVKVSDTTSPTGKEGRHK